MDFHMALGSDSHLGVQSNGWWFRGQDLSKSFPILPEILASDRRGVDHLYKCFPHSLTSVTLITDCVMVYSMRRLLYVNST